MKVVAKTNLDLITAEDVLEKLTQKQGVLVWIKRVKRNTQPVFLKKKFNQAGYAWVTLNFDAGQDNDNIGYDGEFLMQAEDAFGKWIKDKASKEELYWFEDEREAIQWLCRSQYYLRREN